MGGSHGTPDHHCVVSNIARISKMPSQKDGIAIPAIEKVRTAKSTHVFCLTAEMIPSGIAMAILMIVAISAICRLNSNRRPTSSMMGWAVHMDTPKSNVKKLTNQVTNWTSSG